MSGTESRDISLTRPEKQELVTLIGRELLDTSDNIKAAILTRIRGKIERAWKLEIRK